MLRVFEPPPYGPRWPCGRNRYTAAPWPIPEWPAPAAQRKVRRWRRRYFCATHCFGRRRSCVVEADDEVASSAIRRTSRASRPSIRRARLRPTARRKRTPERDTSSRDRVVRLDDPAVERDTVGDWDFEELSGGSEQRFGFRVRSLPSTMSSNDPCDRKTHNLDAVGAVEGSISVGSPFCVGGDVYSWWPGSSSGVIRSGCLCHRRVCGRGIDGPDHRVKQ